MSAVAGPPASATHLVVIPSYDSGALVYATVRAARAAWAPVWVVVDGSTDGTAAGLRALAAADPGLRVDVLARNRGKGAAVLHALEAARAAGFTHALTMDADGQHPAELIGAFMQASAARPDAMVLGRPVFDASAPLLRVRGRRISNWWTNLETLGAGDRRLALRLSRLSDRATGRGHARADLDAPLRLRHRGGRAPGLARRDADQPRGAGQVPAADEGGVSHFRYVRDNVLLTLDAPAPAARLRAAAARAAAAPNAPGGRRSARRESGRRRLSTMADRGGRSRVRGQRSLSRGRDMSSKSVVWRSRRWPSFAGLAGWPRPRPARRPVPRSRPRRARPRKAGEPSRPGGARRAEVPGRRHRYARQIALTATKATRDAREGRPAHAAGRERAGRQGDPERSRRRRLARRAQGRDARPPTRSDELVPAGQGPDSPPK